MHTAHVFGQSSYSMQAEVCRELVKLLKSAVFSVEIMIPPRTGFTVAPAAVCCDQAVSSVLHPQNAVNGEAGLDMAAKRLAFHNETETSAALPG